MEIGKEILEIICCPKDRAKLNHDLKKNKLVCTKCKSGYTVENGVPILLNE